MVTDKTVFTFTGVNTGLALAIEPNDVWRCGCGTPVLVYPLVNQGIASSLLRKIKCPVCDKHRIAERHERT